MVINRTSAEVCVSTSQAIITKEPVANQTLHRTRKCRTKGQNRSVRSSSLPQNTAMISHRGRSQSTSTRFCYNEISNYCKLRITANEPWNGIVLRRIKVQDDAI